MCSLPRLPYMHLDGILGRDALRGTTWSVRVRRGGTDGVVAEHEPDRRLRTASVGKILLLLEVASRIGEGSLSPAAPLSRLSVPWVADSGLWQHLSTDELSVTDAATLVGSVSDNLATNVLLEEVGIEAVAARARSLGVVDAVLHDHVRPERTDDVPWTLSEGSGGEWCDLMLALHEGALSDGSVCRRVLDWVATGTDHSMVAAALHLDPLSHGVDPCSRPRLWSKTGTDDGVRADVGVMADGGRSVGYAAICTWDPEGGPEVADVLDAMRDVGAICAQLVRGDL